VNFLPKSLSVRLLILFTVSAIVMMLSLIFLFSYGLSTEWRQQIRPHLAQYVRYVQKDLGDPPSIERANELAKVLPVEIHIFNEDENQHIHSTNNRSFNPKRYEFTPVRGKFGTAPIQQRSTDEHPRSLRSLEFAQSRHHSVVKIPGETFSVFIELDRKIGARRTERKHLWLLPLVLGALLLALYGLLRRLLSPINDIKSGVATMTQGNLSHQIPVKRNDDLGQLATSVNGLSMRIQKQLDAKRELLLSVSHELRSPITRAHLSTEMMPDSKYKEGVLDELRLLDSLIENLMESERLQSEHSALNLTQLDFKSLILTCVQDVKDEFKDEIGTITINSTDTNNTTITGDEIRLRLLCRNLLNNAVQHGATPGATDSSHSKLYLDISISATDEYLQCTFADHGKGVARNELESLTEAFYRPDPSREHGKGGIGLGLSLAKVIAQAHDGSLTLENRSDGKTGLVAILKLPNTQDQLKSI